MTPGMRAAKALKSHHLLAETPSVAMGELGTVAAIIDRETGGAAVSQYRCPARPRFDGDLVGCGSTNVTGPDSEGLYDCECGMWFKPELERPEDIEVKHGSDD